MRLIRFIGNITLWFGALLGVLAGAVWSAGQFGLLQPMIVISGSMEPEIMTGDLLISHQIPTDTVEIGDVLSLPSGLTGNLVTHRVISVEPDGETWKVRMKGDDNAEPDLEPYTVGDEVLTPWIQIPQAGKVVSKLMEPAVAMPILLSLIALLGLSLLDEPHRKVVRRVVDRVRQRDPRLDELDAELAAAGIDVGRLQEMDDLDLALYALGVDVTLDANAGTDEPETAPPDEPPTRRRNGRGVEDGLWDFTIPPSDGVGLVHISSRNPPRPTAPYDPLLPSRVAELAPARSG